MAGYSIASFWDRTEHIVQQRGQSVKPSPGEMAREIEGIDKIKKENIGKPN